MNIGQLKELLNLIDDDEIPVLVDAGETFKPACITDSGVVKDNLGKEIFVLLACFCHADSSVIRDVAADDFPMIEN